MEFPSNSSEEHGISRRKSTGPQVFFSEPKNDNFHRKSESPLKLLRFLIPRETCKTKTGNPEILSLAVALLKRFKKFI
jgi:hypothetical protein